LKIEKLEFVFCQNTLIAKFGLLWGRILIMGKRGSFLALDQFYSWNISRFAQTSVFDLEEKEFDLQKQIKWWQRVIQICQILSKKNLVFICIDVAHFYCFLMCLHKSPKRGRLKGKCALGISVSILVIRCPTHIN
jgi:hypothetical protein